MIPETLVMIPTYNEKENLPDLISEIIKMKNVGVVIVDDNSPDGTGKIAETLSKKYNGRVFAVHRKERGRGTAGIEGFRKCLKLGAQYVVEMDADFSHDTKYIPVFLERIKNYDVILGSRFVTGGRDAERVFFRRVLTKFARFYIKTVMSVKIEDPTSGFKIYRSGVIKNIVDKLRSPDHFITLEILFYLKRYNFRIGEFPIEFKEREHGSSKLKFYTIIKVLVKCIKLRLGMYSIY